MPGRVEMTRRQKWTGKPAREGHSALYGVGTVLAGADADSVTDGIDEDLTVAGAPVMALVRITSTALSVSSSLTTTSTFTLGNMSMR